MTASCFGGLSFPTVYASQGSLPSSLTAISKEGVAARIGVFSDVHINKHDGQTAETNGAAKKLDKALTTYDAQNVDGIVMNGDIVYQVNSSFSNSTADDLSEIPYTIVKDVLSKHGYFDLETNTPADNIVYSTGNHEFPQANVDTEVGQRALDLFKTQMNMDIKEDTVINGFHCITAGGATYSSVMTEETKNWVLERIDAAHAEDETKPVFVFMHHPIHETVIGSDAVSNSRYGADFKAELNKRPYCIVFTAHNHTPSQNPLSVWQDGFTVVHSPLIAGGYLGIENGVSADLVPNLKGNITTDQSSQGLMLDVSTDNVVSIYRFNFISDEIIGEPYVIDISAGADGFKYKSRTARVPYFESRAALIKEAVGDNSIKITFPSALVGAENGENEGYVSKYRVEAIDDAYDAVSFSKTYTSDYYCSPSLRKETFTVEITGLDEAEKYTVKVTPISCLGGEGTPLELSVKTTGQKPPRDFIQKEVNVALNKTAASSVLNSNPERANDGDDSTLWWPGENKADGEKYAWWMVDLGREYKIKRIEIYDGNNEWNEHRQNIVVEGSQNADFSNATEIDKILTNDDEKYPRNGCWTIGAQETPFRYIRVRKTNEQKWCPYLREVKVFADVKLTEVLKGKPAYASDVPYTTHTAKMANDGDADTSWLTYSAEYPYWYADMGTEYSIDYLELLTADNDVEARRFVDIFGSKEKITDSTDFDTLHKFLSYGSNQFVPTDGYAGTVNSPDSYRYIGFKKTYNYGTSCIKEIKAYTLSPDVNKISLSDSGVVIRFSDEMNTATLNPDEIKIYDMSTGKEIEYTQYSYSSLEYTAAVPLEIGKTYKVTVSNEAANMKNAAMPDTYSEIMVYGELPSYDSDMREKRVLVNVAQFKPVKTSTEGYSDGINDPECANDGLVDGNKWNPGAAFKDSENRVWWMVDLGRDYRVERIEIYDANDGWDVHRKNLVVEGSQDSDFSNVTEIDKIDSNGDSEKYLRNGCWTINVENDTPIRYVRIRRTDAQTWCPYIREIKVFAEQTVTEVSKNKTAVAGYGENASYANDGIGDTLWKDTNSSEHKAWWSADLEDSYYIEYFEIDDSADAQGTRRSFEIRGSNEAEINEASVTNADRLAYLSAATNLHTLQNDPFPEGGTWKSAANSAVPYRHLIWTTSNNVTNAALADIRAYVVNPEIYEFEAKNNKITIKFSDVMLASTLSNETVKVYDKNGNEVSYSDYSADGNTYTIAGISLTEGDVYSIVVGGGARNIKLAPVAKLDNTKRFIYGAACDAEYIKLGDLTSGGTLSATASIKNNTDADVDAMIIVALYKGDTLYKTEIVDKSAAANSKTRFSAQLSLPENDIESYSAKAFIWYKGTNVPMTEAITK